MSLQVTEASRVEIYLLMLYLPRDKKVWEIILRLRASISKWRQVQKQNMKGNKSKLKLEAGETSQWLRALD